MSDPLVFLAHLTHLLSVFRCRLAAQKFKQLFINRKFIQRGKRAVRVFSYTSDVPSQCLLRHSLGRFLDMTFLACCLPSM